MAGLWSVLTQVVLSLFGDTTASGTRGATTPGPDDEGNGRLRAMIAAFVGDDSQLAGWLSDRLNSHQQYDLVIGAQGFAPAEGADPVQAWREAHFQALNAAARQDADAILWGDIDPAGKAIHLRFSNKATVAPGNDLLVPLVHVFKPSPTAALPQAARILLATEKLRRTVGGAERRLQMTRLQAEMQTIGEKIAAGDNPAGFEAGLATVFAFAAFVLAETGDRSACPAALKMIEPLTMPFMPSASGKPVTVVATTSLSVADTALLALYGGLLNWSMISDVSDRSGKMAMEVWQILVRHFEFLPGATTAQALCHSNLGEASIACGKTSGDGDLITAGMASYRRAIGLINPKTQPGIYARAAYGLGEALVAHSDIEQVDATRDQAIPIFQAALKVCPKRDYPYLWGRAVFALATVQSHKGRGAQQDASLLQSARNNFIQAQYSFEEAGALGAARAAHGGYLRMETLIDQAGKRKAVVAATGG
ncbi:hypothetical protein [Thalassospira sp.]|uniref:hypothetical protein n=1 Tax=Thalassospira sp. TaxID=1912094 RepID=UPI002734F9E7|nr:hypothetical protein [Thalassospira sp.]MDP2699017.1 hypothetical protein [Thalassospira sp.]